MQILRGESMPMPLLRECKPVPYEYLMSCKNYLVLMNRCIHTQHVVALQHSGRRASSATGRVDVLCPAADTGYRREGGLPLNLQYGCG